MTTRVFDALRRVGAALDELDRPWALVGGMAISARTEPRFTRDVDVAVVVANDADAERLVLSLKQRRFTILALVEHEALGRLATVRLVSGGEAAAGVVVDLLFASSGIEREVVAGAERLELDHGLSFPVATAGHLLALKLLSRDDDRRPQDVADLKALFGVIGDADMQIAVNAIASIERRGFHRGRAR